MITLTSIAERNSIKDMKHDFTYFIKCIRRKNERNGKDIFEYVAIPELTPKRGLLHLHAIVRTSEWLNEDYLKDLWRKIHRANEIDCRQLGSTEEDIERVSKYCAKHLVKQYGDTALKCRPLISKGWLPENWYTYFKALNKIGAKGGDSWENINRYKKDYCKLIARENE